MDLQQDIKEICNLFSGYAPRNSREKNLIELLFSADHEDLKIVSYIVSPLLEALSDNTIPDISVGDIDFDNKIENPGEQGSTYHWSKKGEFKKKIGQGFSYYIGTEEDSAEIGLQTDMGEVGELPEQELLSAEEYEPREGELALGRSLEPIDLSNYPELVGGDKKKVMGADIAAHGSHKSVLVLRWGNIIFDIQSYAKQDTVTTTEKIISAIKQYGIEEIVLDSTGGLGASIGDMLIRAGIEDICTVTMVHFNAPPREERFGASNARAELYLKLDELLRQGEVILPPQKELVSNLVSVKYTLVGENLVKLWPKEKTRLEMGESPDYGDALCLSYYNSGGLEIY